MKIIVSLLVAAHVAAIVYPMIAARPPLDVRCAIELVRPADGCESAR